MLGLRMARLGVLFCLPLSLLTAVLKTLKDKAL